MEARPPEAMTGMETAGQFEGRGPVDAGEDAVAVDVGVDDRGNASAFEALGQLEDEELAGLAQPSTATLPPFASMPTAIGPEQPAGLVHQRRVTDGDRAEDDAGETTRQPLFDMSIDRIPPPS